MSYEVSILLLRVLMIVIVFLIVTLVFIFIKYKQNKENESIYKRLSGYSKDCLYYYQIYPETKFIYI